MKILPTSSLNYRSSKQIQNFKNINFNRNSLKADTVSFTGTDRPLKSWEVVEYFKKMGVRSKVKLDRTVSVYKYVPKKRDIERLEQAGMDEDTLFKYVTEVEGSVDLTNSKLKNLGSTREIGGFLKTGKNLEDFGELIGIGMELDMTGSPILDWCKLKYIGGNLITDNRWVYNAFVKKLCIEGDIILQAARKC